MQNSLRGTLLFVFDKLGLREGFKKKFVSRKSGLRGRVKKKKLSGKAI